MRATITVDDALLGELLSLTGTENRTTAINVAIESHVRRVKLERLRALAGKVAIDANADIESADLEEARSTVATPPRRRGERG